MPRRDTAQRPRRTGRPGPTPPHDGPGAVSPPLRWARRFTPLGLGRRGVRLQLSGGSLSIVRVGPLGGERVVLTAPVREFHGLAPSRGGRGLHLWHGTRLFRLVGRAEGTDGDSGSTDVSSSSADDPVGAVLALLTLPLHLFAALAAHRGKVAAERRHVATTLRWLGPVVGPPWPGVAVRPPLPAGLLSAGRWAVRLTVLLALVAGGAALL